MMVKITPALWGYISAGLIYIISALLHWDMLVLTFKPVIGSSILFHYWVESGSRFKWLYLFVLFLYFVSGVFNMFEDADVLQYIILINMSIYLILLVIIVLKIRQLKVYFLDRFNLLYVLLSTIFVCTLVYLSVFLIFNESFKWYNYTVIYAIVLGVLGVFASVLYVYQPEKANVYLTYAVFCYLMCDIFYIIYYYAYDFIFFRMLSILGSVISYYCLVNFFLKDKGDRDLKKYL